MQAAALPAFDEPEDELTVVRTNPVTVRDPALSPTLASSSGPISVVLNNLPFGSTLSTYPLRVSVNRGEVTALCNGQPTSLAKLPNWELQELFRYIEWVIQSRTP